MHTDHEDGSITLQANASTIERVEVEVRDLEREYTFERNVGGTYVNVTCDDDPSFAADFTCNGTISDLQDRAIAWVEDFYTKDDNA